MTMRLKARAAMLGLVALGSGAPAAAEIVRTTDNSFVSRHEAVVKATAKETWLALISPSGWWQAAHTWSGDPKNLTLTPQAGGCFCERIPEVDEPGRFTLEGSVEHMRVVQAYPEQALRMVGNLGPLQSEPVAGVLTIALTKVEQGTRIVWEYNVGGPMRYEVPVISKAVDAVMAAQLGALAKQLGVVALPVAPAVAPAPDASAGASAVKPPAAPAGTKTAPGPAPAAASAPRVAPSANATTPAKPATAQVPAGTGAAIKPAGAAAVPVKPAATQVPAGTGNAAKPTGTPPKPAAKTPSVEDAFGDLKDKPKPKR